MPKLIKDFEIVEDNWQVLGLDGCEASIDVPAGNVIVPLAVWQAQKDQLQARAQTLGVWLNSDQMAEELGDDATQLALVAVYFPGFMDGRGFSTARLLRERYGFSGELRAFGDIFRDQLFFLKRCGFNSFSMPEGTDLEKNLASLQDFSETYQAACDQPLPLFRRRS
ncbi:DUF934 domain-containing protein [Pseudomaricurvus alcaniphilus]|uniref:DUF934 domain-containing protein n=1 Tax=Pseudomaricurvus alcaniphilus TaxID=1166482 RepID=UPI00140CFCF6|nr:DUF934 domain-containing protein [Pseudomaricurvus alcaniphilus]NHN35818.1 DUF934 domain-containing protein [Pseudomaricurvus alcaniphilus]